MNKIIITLITLSLLITACDGGRYAVAMDHRTNDPCYVYDFKEQKRLEPTPENISLTEGDSFWADPKQCD